MVVGVLTWTLQLYGSQSLKAKRRVIRSVKDRLRNRFNVSVAETALHDVHQRAEITACVVATDRKRAERVLDRADQLVEEEAEGRIMDTVRTLY